MKYHASLLILGGAFAWACVNPMKVDDENLASGGGLAATGGEGPAASGGQASSADGGAESGGTAPTASGGMITTASGGAAAEASGGAESICPLNDEVQYDKDAAYPFCQPSPEGLCPVSNLDEVTGRDEIAWKVSDGDACMCWELCAEASDCPSADSGTAAPECVKFISFQPLTSETPGYCVLRCENGETCPDGMQCELKPEGGGSVCAWVTGGSACDESDFGEFSTEIPALTSVIPECPFDDELEYDPGAAYPYCEGHEPFGWVNRCRYSEAVHTLPDGNKSGIGGEGMSSWRALDAAGAEVNLCLCAEYCDTDAECSPGETGTAQPACLRGHLEVAPSGSYSGVDVGTCALTCDDGETCPDGMVCMGSALSLAPKFCAWPSRGAGCNTSTFPDVTPGEEPTL